MGEVIYRTAAQTVDRHADHIGEPAIGVDDRAVDAAHRDGDRRIVEHHPEPFLGRAARLVHGQRIAATKSPLLQRFPVAAPESREQRGESGRIGPGQLREHPRRGGEHRCAGEPRLDQRRPDRRTRVGVEWFGGQRGREIAYQPGE